MRKPNVKCRDDKSNLLDFSLNVAPHKMGTTVQRSGFMGATVTQLTESRLCCDTDSNLLAYNCFI